MSYKAHITNVSLCLVYCPCPRFHNNCNSFSLSLYVSILETSDFAIQIHAHACTDAVQNTESHAVQNAGSHAVRI